MPWVEDVVRYLLEIVNDQVLPLQDILREIPRAPVSVRSSLTKRLQNLEQLETFLESQNDHFIVENGYVALWDENLETGRETAVDYFEKELDLYDEPPYYLNFRGHIGQAGNDIIDYINTFYPGEEFKKFLLAHPDVFCVFDDDTVCLIENESVDYFEECLEKRGSLNFMNLRGHLGQAPGHIIEFINTQYPRESFLEFLEKNSHVFDVDAGYVSLNPQDAN